MNIERSERAAGVSKTQWSRNSDPLNVSKTQTLLLCRKLRPYKYNKSEFARLLQVVLFTVRRYDVDIGRICRGREREKRQKKSLVGSRKQYTTFVSFFWVAL